MKRLVFLIAAAGLMAAIPMAIAQRPGDGRDAPPANESLESRLMPFDANKDGKLTKAELTDERLQRLFDRADADHDGVVTKQELTALAAREPAGGRGGFGGPGGPGGFGGPGGRGGPGGFRMGPRPGEILPAMFRDRLELTAEQSKQVDALQKDVDARLEKILNEDQRQQLKEMRQRGPGGPGGFGPPGGGPGGRRGGPGGFGPPPPDGPDGDRPPPPDRP
jgi:CubicO group peptidase (beta-lactamase class C family)